MTLLGPFQVDPEAIERLSTAFTAFVNELLVRESARAQLLGHELRVDSQDNTPDGGVDAALHAQATTWLPNGESCWQFKRSDLKPAECAKELQNATWAKELLKSGATYTLVLGRRLGDQKIAARRSKLVAKAIALGLVSGDDGRIRVLDANAIARWATEFPSLAVSAMLGAPGYDVIDFETWSASNRHEFQWISNQDRDDGIKTIRATLAADTFREIHVSGESGVGKTRMVMEALREANLSALVIYVPDQQLVSGEILGYVLAEGRTAVLVVDECEGRSHEKLAERIPTGAALRLVTMGEPDTYSLRSPVLNLLTMKDTEIEAFLAPNFPPLSAEARRFIGQHSSGNVRFAIVLAERILENGGAQAAELISRDDVEELVQSLLPDGRPFFLSTILALFERVGWEREVGAQLVALAAFTGASEDELRDVGRDLESRGLLTKQGRYRAIAPHPLAVVLAASAWRTEGQRFIDELLPGIDREMTLSLFSRVADLGRYDPARKVLRQLMSRDGPFGSLESIEQHELGRLVTQLAIVAPDETMQHLGDLIGSASLVELRNARGSRRDLVWALEKLAWHRQTFESAADSLLQLALAENETFANNATGTWIDLFGTLLPGTAAIPAERVAYLQRIATDPDRDKRLFATKGAARALAGQHESIAVSGELQGGALVEPRGSPATWGEAGDYRRANLAILGDLIADEDESVAGAAADVLISAVHPLIDDQFVGDDLIAVLRTLEGDALTRLRKDVESLISLHDRHGPGDGPDPVERLRALSDALPSATDLEQLRVLLQLRQWDLQAEQLSTRIGEKLGIISDEERQSVLDLMKSEEIPAAWELGTALASTGENAELEGVLVDAFALNSSALTAYLTGLDKKGDDSAFDRFLDGPVAGGLEPDASLFLAARGPATERAKIRILNLAREISVAQAARSLFGWQRNLGEAEIASLASDWSERLTSQQDYNALIDWLNLPHPPDQGLPESLRGIAFKAIMMRRDFPEVGQQRWDWAQLAGAFVTDHGDELATLIFDLIDSDQLMVHHSDYESAILLRCASEHPAAVWGQMASHLGDGSWRVQMQTRGWLVTAIPAAVIGKWIGRSIKRARLVASIASAGESEPTELARLLLERFGDDPKIRSSLWGDFVSGSWSGPESDRLQMQITQLDGWRTRPGGSKSIRGWASEMIGHLETRRERALEEEAEGRF